MGFSSLRFFQFRNLADEKIQVDAPEIFLVGENGQGKTNVLEAVYYLSLGSSFRTRKDDTVIRQGFSEAAIEGLYSAEDTPDTSVVVKLSGSGKEIRLDDKGVKDRGELLGRFPCVVFCHDDIFFVSGSPDQQRLFFNQTLSLSDPGFIELWRRYSRILKQRNAAVKTADWNMVDLYDIEFTRLGMELSDRRREVVTRFSEIFSRLFTDISGIETPVGIRYLPSWKNSKEEEILDFLKKRRPTDAALFTSTSGPHRDRFRFLFGERDFKSTASTGQVRLASLILKTAQAVHYSEVSRRRPLLLLDDVLLEMDPIRRKRFISRLPDYEQAFFTFLPDERFSSYRKTATLVFQVREGRVETHG
jgi:DNA replication and repair protein RecF